MGRVNDKIDLSENAVLANIRPPPPPPGVPSARWKAFHGESGDSLSFYRGQQIGQYEAYLVIGKEHPRVAKKILKVFNMEENGDIVL